MDDLEDDDWMRAPLASQETVDEEGGAAKKRQKKVLTLDDLLQAERKETVRKLKKSKKLIQKLNAKSYLYTSSDEEEDSGKIAIPKMLADLETQVAVAEEVEPEYGAHVFTAPREFPSLTRGAPVSLERALQTSKEAGRETSLEELARSGFLRAWALGTNRCDEATLRWAYHQMVFSVDESVERAACKFLCDLVSRIDMGTGAPLQMDWLPALVDVKETLVFYGYSEEEGGGSSSESSIPPRNLRSLLEFKSTCFTTRDMGYSVVDLEALLILMMHLTLERGLLPILDKLQDCVLALIRSFTSEDWEQACPRVTAGILRLTDEAHNGVFLLGVLSGLGTRSMELQKRLALGELAKLSGRKALSTAREVTAAFEKVNLKAKEVDFEKVYYQLVIADTFLWCNEGLQDEVARLRWLKFLGACSRQIFIGDERAFATKLRNVASFFIEKYEHDGHDRESSPVNFVEETFE